jgi:hypothetical protein
MEQWSKEVRTTFDSTELDDFFGRFEPIDLDALFPPESDSPAPEDAGVQLG